jgi:hypothetical protein
MANNKIQKVVTAADAAKGAPTRPLTVTPQAPLREGARAPQVSTPSNLPMTSGPVSVTKPKS